MDKRKMNKIITMPIRGVIIGFASIVVCLMMAMQITVGYINNVISEWAGEG